MMWALSCLCTKYCPHLYLKDFISVNGISWPSVVQTKHLCVNLDFSFSSQPHIQFVRKSHWHHFPSKARIPLLPTISTTHLALRATFISVMDYDNSLRSPHFCLCLLAPNLVSVQQEQDPFSKNQSMLLLRHPQGCPLSSQNRSLVSLMPSKALNICSSCKPPYDLGGQACMTQVLGPYSHGRSRRGSWLQVSSILTIVAFWGVNPHTFSSLLVCLSDKNK